MSSPEAKEWEEGGQKVQTCRCKISKCEECGVEHGDCI